VITIGRLVQRHSCNHVITYLTPRIPEYDNEIRFLRITRIHPCIWCGGNESIIDGKIASKRAIAIRSIVNPIHYIVCIRDDAIALVPRIVREMSRHINSTEDT
jgi:hypothetical protein